MRVDHNLILCSRFRHAEIMVHHPLSVVMFAARDDATYIARLYGIISVFVHKAERIVHLAFVIGYR